MEESADASQRRVAPGFPTKIPLKAGCKPALQPLCPAPVLRKWSNLATHHPTLLSAVAPAKAEASVKLDLPVHYLSSNLFQSRLIQVNPA
jgi:hypothetical protein